MNTDFPKFPEGLDPETYRRDVELFGEQVQELAGSITQLSKSSTGVVRAFQTMYSALKYKKEFGVISDGEYFDELAKLRDRYFSRGSQEWYKYTQEIYNGKVEMLYKYKESVLDHLEDMSKIFSEELSEIAEAREQFAEKLDHEFGTGTGYRTVKTTIHGYFDNDEPWVFYDYFLEDFDKEILELQDFDATLKALMERGKTLSPDTFRAFFEELRTLPIEDAGILAKLLLESDDKEFLHYLEGFHKKKELTKSISVSLYSDDFENLMSEIETGLTDVFSQIPPEFSTFGEMTAENFKEGFLGEIETIFGDIEALFEENSFDFEPSFWSKENASVFSPIYNFYGGEESVLEQLLTAKSQSILDKLRLQSEE